MWRLTISLFILLLITGCNSFSVYKNSENSFGQNDLMRAVYYQDMEKFKELLNKNSGLFEKDETGANILHYIAKYGTEQMAIAVLKKGTEALLLDEGGMRSSTPLQEAEFLGKDDIYTVFYESLPIEGVNP